jgi:hypothetical protein
VGVTVTLWGYGEGYGGLREGYGDTLLNPFSLRPPCVLGIWLRPRRSGVAAGHDVYGD